MTEENVIETIPAANMPIKLGVTKQALAKLKKKYAKCPDATTPEGYKAIKSAKSELTPLRTGVEKERKLQVAAALAHQKRVNSEAKEITEAIIEIETPLYAAKKAVDDEAEQVLREAEQKEAERIDLIESKIEEINNMDRGITGQPSEYIRNLIEILENIDISEEVFQEYLDAAEDSAEKMMKILSTANEERVRIEYFEENKAEQERVMAEQKAKLDAQQAELDAIENERMIKEREVAAAKEAAEAATRQAEANAQAEIEQAKQREDDLKQVAVQAQKEAAETEQRVIRESAEKVAKEKAEADAREADINHKKSINNAAVKCLVKAGVSESAAKKCVTAIAQRKVDNVTISY